MSRPVSPSQMNRFPDALVTMIFPSALACTLSGELTASSVRVWIFWPATVVWVSMGRIGPINPGVILQHFVLIYSVMFGLPIVLYWRRRRRVDALLRRAFRRHPKKLELKGYDLFAMCRFVRQRIKKKEAISVELSVEEGTLPA